jgi:hypothetical protein
MTQQAVNTWRTATSEFTSGSTVRLLVELCNGQAVVQESLSQSNTLDVDSGIPFVLSQTPTTTGGGLTTQEHDWLDAVQQAVQTAMSDLAGLGISTPVGSLLAHPDIRLLDRVTPCTTITSRGSLSPPSGFGWSNVYGIEVIFDTVPPGFGTRDGAVVEYEERVVQFCTVHRSNSGSFDYISEIRDMHSQGQVWYWQQYDPVDILYDVTPGCQVTICYMTLLGA